MRNFIYLALSLSLFSSCLKEKEFNCKCTYVANAGGPNAGQPNKEESNVIKSRLQEDAEIDCLGLEGKYISQFYQGTCLIN